MAVANRLALVTGGARGIGKAVCQLLAREGASVAVADILEEGAQRTADSLHRSTQDTKHMSFPVNVSSKENVKSALQNIREHFSRAPCIVVNAAGIVMDTMMIKMSEERFDQVINVNLKGTFLVTQAASIAMIEEKLSGSIVNISSIVARCGNIGQANYSASKGGVISMTKTCALELSRYGIRCNVVLPGFIETEMTDGVPKQVIDQVIGMVPMERIGQPQEVAEGCLFLVSDKSSYITGSSLEISGGL